MASMEGKMIDLENTTLDDLLNRVFNRLPSCVCQSKKGLMRRIHNPNCNHMFHHGGRDMPKVDGIQLRLDLDDNWKFLDTREFNVKSHSIAVCFEYSSYDARLETFRNWKNNSQKPENLAAAGFYSTGNEDDVCCYYCNNGFRKWGVTNDPWVEHVKWFSDCGFLNLVKGVKVLDENVFDRFNTLLSRPLTEEATSSSSSSSGEITLDSGTQQATHIQQGTEEIMEENRRLKEDRLCKICVEHELCVVMLPCAHLVTCIACASQLPNCPLCRQKIKATVCTFL